jgi:hypothetical protein
MMDRKQREQGRKRPQSFSQVINPCDLLTPAKAHLLKFPKLSKIAPPTGNQAFKS